MDRFPAAAVGMTPCGTDRNDSQHDREKAGFEKAATAVGCDAEKMLNELHEELLIIAYG